MALKSFVGGTIFGATHGTGAPEVLALHGWGRSHRDFDEVLGGFNAVALDLPGFGATPVPNAVWGAREYAASLVPILREFSAPPVVVGHSFGGRVAVCLAARHPELVKALLIIGAPLVRPPDYVPPKSPWRYRLIRTLSNLRLISDDRLEEARRRHGSADYRAASGVMRDVLVRVVNETYEDELAALKVPVHLLWGSNDLAAPVGGAHHAKDLLDIAGVDGSLAVLSGVGHDVMDEAPGKVASELRMLLDR